MSEKIHGVDLNQVFPTIKCRNCGGPATGVNGRLFRRLREEVLLFSQRGVAREVGLSWTFLQELEKGGRRASYSTAKILRRWATGHLSNLGRQDG